MKLNSSLLIIQQWMNVNFLNILEQQKAYEKFSARFSWELSRASFMLKREISPALIPYATYKSNPELTLFLSASSLFILSSAPFPSGSAKTNIMQIQNRFAVVQYPVCFATEWCIEKKFFVLNVCLISIYITFSCHLQSIRVSRA